MSDAQPSHPHTWDFPGWSTGKCPPPSWFNFLLSSPFFQISIWHISKQCYHKYLYCFKNETFERGKWLPALKRQAEATENLKGQAPRMKSPQINLSKAASSKSHWVENNTEGTVQWHRDIIIIKLIREYSYGNERCFIWLLKKNYVYFWVY